MHMGSMASLAGLVLLAVVLLFVQAGGMPQWPAPSPLRLQIALLALLLYGLFCGGVMWQRRRQHRATPASRPATLAAGDEPALLLAFASQTGYAEQLAWRSAESLTAGGVPVRVLPLGQIQPALLAATGRALFIVSTTGEGDAPDHAGPFVRAMAQPAALGSLRYGLLALGDREYAQYCGFGHTLDRWLRQAGAQSMFDVVEVDDGDEGALRHWQQHLGQISGQTRVTDWQAPRYESWRLVARQHLNPGSVGGAVFLLRLEGPQRSWQPGDIAEVGPRHAPERVASLLRTLRLDPDMPVQWRDQALTLAQVLSGLQLPGDDAGCVALHGLAPQALVDALRPLPHREYSIASLPQDGALELLVRQQRGADGELGLGSGWLTAHARLGGEVALRIRENRAFHPPEADVPMILVGNGTGLAGLRAQLRARAALGRHRNWLLFGERNAAHDYFLRDEIERWYAAGVLQGLDLAFSRDAPERVYVQHRLAGAASELRRWVEQGAAVYVCGSLEGMAPAVTRVLVDTLGQPCVDALVDQGRYRRDVY